MARTVISGLLWLLYLLTGSLLVLACLVQPARAAWNPEVWANAAAMCYAGQGFMLEAGCHPTWDPSQDSYFSTLPNVPQDTTIGCVSVGPATIYAATTGTGAICAVSTSTGATKPVECPVGGVTTVSVPYYRASGGTAEGGPTTMVQGSIKTLPSTGCYASCTVEYGSYHLSQNPPVFWRSPYDPDSGPVDVYLHVAATTTGTTCTPQTGAGDTAQDQPASNISCLIDSATGQCATCAIDQATGTCATTQPGGGTTGGGTTGGGTTGGGTTGGGTTGGASGTGTTGGTAAGPGNPASGSSSGFGGTCSAGFSCSGDPVQCAQAQAAWELQCVFRADPADPSASAAEAAYAASSPGPAASSVNFSLSTWTDRVVGPNGGCPADVVIGHGMLSATLPFSQYCGVLQNIGLAGNAISMLIAVGIVFGRKASEVV